MKHAGDQARNQAGASSTKRPMAIRATAAIMYTAPAHFAHCIARRLQVDPVHARCDTCAMTATIAI